jgi:hypothetical protein
VDINYQMRQLIQAPVERTLARDLLDVANLPERSSGRDGS